MKKFLLSLLMLLSFAGVSFATSIPEAIEPNAGGANVWLESVYNNSGSSMAAGSVAVWQVGSSTGGVSNWVTTTTTADTFLVAGVVYPSAIAAGAVGTIAIKGPVNVNAIAGHLNTVGGVACSSATAGSAQSCTTTAANFGIVTVAASGGVAKVFVRAN